MENLKVALLSNGIRYIAVEGSIGAGKTTLSRLIAEASEARLFLEEIDDNPFIERFYEDMQGYAFQAQIFFLLNRYRQQIEIAQQDLFDELLVADYLFAKDTIYAHAVLGDNELVLYNKLHALLEGKIVRPDLVIYLQANPEILLQRIRKRGRSFERSISEEYLSNLNEAFNHFFFHYDESPLLIVNTDRLDFMACRDHLDDLLSRITEKFEGTRCYVPSWKMDLS
ncbi:MAG: deoxynucleoside kinase [Candidatus Krumholzibacteria bacterium]|nr:deoxynucleoside kinase [Candidatus Krumholzibacteria bacterium]